jgi:hypothetical protein
MAPVSAEVLSSFHLRLYHWVEHEWTEEVRTRFARLSSVQSIEAAGFVGTLHALPSDRLGVLTKALNKCRPLGPKAVVGDLVGGVSFEERREVELFRAAAWSRMSATTLTGSTGAWTTKRARRGVLRKAVREALHDVAGEPEAFGGDDEWRHRTILGPWTVYTHIDLSDRQQQLEYHHAVRSGENGSLLESASLMSWLGIVGSTRWNTLSSGAEVEAATVVRGLCAHFLAALTALLEGLDRA